MNKHSHALVLLTLVAATACGEKLTEKPKALLPDDAGTLSDASDGAVGVEGGAVDASLDATGGAASDAGPIRTVEQRNPFGNTQDYLNLVADGDFEFTGRQQQQPWLVFTTAGQETLAFETGGRCRSGVRCAALDPGKTMIGWVASPKTDGMYATIWAKPLSGSCKDVYVSLVNLDTQVGGDLKVSPIDDKGWCRFSGEAPNMAGKNPVLLVETPARAQAKVLIDDGWVTAVPIASLATRALFRLGPEQAARVAFIAEWLRTHRRFGVAGGSNGDWEMRAKRE